MASEFQLLQSPVVQLEDGAEAGHVLPEEAQETQLTQNTNDFRSAMLLDDDAMCPAPEDLDSLGECIGVVEEGRGRFPTE